LLLLRAHRWRGAAVAADATAAVVGSYGRAGLPYAFCETSLELVRAVAGRSVGGCYDHKAERKKVHAHDALFVSVSDLFIFEF
jgi:hypothetical protein